ncbi:hypothetical protein ACOMHN_032581 [Nucella lapillus]
MRTAGEYWVDSMTMAAATDPRVKGGALSMTAMKRGMTVWLVVWALTLVPGGWGKVTCNEYDTCLPADRQLNLTLSIRQGHKQHVCVLASSAMKCLAEARKDCNDARYHNMPTYIIRGLEDKRNNMTAYAATYCGEKPPPPPTSTSRSIQQVKQGGNGFDVTVFSWAVTVGWTVLVSVYLSGQ